MLKKGWGSNMKLKYQFFHMFFMNLLNFSFFFVSTHYVLKCNYFPFASLCILKLVRNQFSFSNFRFLYFQLWIILPIAMHQAMNRQPNALFQPGGLSHIFPSLKDKCQHVKVLIAGVIGKFFLTVIIKT